MIAPADPRSIVVAFPGDGDGPPTIQVGSSVTIGQLAQVAWELGHMADDARRGMQVAQAQQRLETLAVAQRLQAGRKQ